MGSSEGENAIKITKVLPQEEANLLLVDGYYC
jgi:hypothetical protein